MILNAFLSLDNTKAKIRYVFEWYREPDQKPTSFQNPYNVIWFVLDGERILSIQDQVYPIKRGDLVVIPPSTSFSILSEEGRSEPLHYLSVGCDWKVGSFNFVDLYQFPKIFHIHNSENFDSLKTLWLELLKRWNQFVAEVDPEYTELNRTFSLPRIEINTHQTGAFLNTIGLFYQWAATFIQLTQAQLPITPKLPDARVEKVCHFVNNNYASPLTMNDLCGSIFMSHSRVRHLFKQNLNISPMSYVQKVRLDRAKELLIETKEPIGYIARKVGFEDVSYFSRLFHKRESMTPAEYRKKMSLF